MTTGYSIYLWRTHRNMTQAQLAGLCGISRPNLSAIEQGARDLTVRTLKRLSAALNIHAGLLADGKGPYFLKSAPLDRLSLDKIARLVAGQSLPASEQEKNIAQDLSSVMTCKIGHAAGKNFSSTTERVLRLKTLLGPDVFKHLVRRVEKNLWTSINE